MIRRLIRSVGIAAVLLAASQGNAQQVITGPWLWMIVPTEEGQGGAASTDIDQLAVASGGQVTEETVASFGAQPGDRVGVRAWKLGELTPGGPDNLTELTQRISFSEGPLDDQSAYALVTVISSEEQRNVIMRVGSDDSVKVWLNGKVVHKNSIDRPSFGFQDTFEVALRAGDNRLLVKVGERAGEWSFRAGIQASFTAVEKVYEPSLDVETLLAVATYYREQSRFEEATRQYEQAERLPTDPQSLIRIRVGLWECYRRQGKSKEAQDIESELMAHWNPDDLQQSAALGTAFVEMRRYQEALKVFEAVLQKRPDEFFFLERLAGVHEALGNTELAEEYRKKADPGRLLIGQEAPEFSGNDLASNLVTLSQHRGKVVLISFWASW